MERELQDVMAGVSRLEASKPTSATRAVETPHDPPEQGDEESSDEPRQLAGRLRRSRGGRAASMTPSQGGAKTAAEPTSIVATGIKPARGCAPGASTERESVVKSQHRDLPAAIVGEVASTGRKRARQAAAGSAGQRNPASSAKRLRLTKELDEKEVPVPPVKKQKVPARRGAKTGPETVAAKSDAEPGPSEGEKAGRKPSASKFNPHVDGRGPPLDGNWKEQIAECPVDPNRLKIAVWNVNGIRAVLRKSSNPGATAPSDLQTYLKEEKPDVLCLGETKIDDALLAEIMTKQLPNYSAHFVQKSEKKGYAGVAILVRKNSGLEQFVEKEIEGIGEPDGDAEGRTLALVFPKCVLVNSYVVNAGQGLKRLNYKVTRYNPAMYEFLNKLRSEYKRSVIWCGDLNCAYLELDIWNSKANQKSAGHTPEERASFGSFIAQGDWVDIWRRHNPNKRRYTFYPARSVRARLDGLGWRLDYFIVSEDLMREEDDAKVYFRDLFRGSDHCPLLLTLPKARVV